MKKSLKLLEGNNPKTELMRKTTLGQMMRQSLNILMKNIGGVNI